MDDLVQWLRAQLDEDEVKARTVGEETWEARYVDSANDYPDTATVRLSDGTDIAVMERYSMQDAEHIATWDPARVLREIDAKRQVIAHYQKVFQEAVDGADSYVKIAAALSRQIRILAAVYTDRPGYREEWRP